MDVNKPGPRPSWTMRHRDTLSGGMVTFGSTTVTGVERIAAFRATEFADDIH